MNRAKERLMHGVFLGAALASIFAVAMICAFLFGSGIPAMAKIGVWEFIAGREWSPSDVPPLFGILPMILGSVWITLGAVAVGVPIGVLAAVFLAKICPRPLHRVMKPAIELLSGIPSVVYGFFGIVVLVPMVRALFGDILGMSTNGSSILTASILLGIMILPTIIGITESAILAVPQSYYDGAVALGASHERAVFRVILPAAKSSVMAAVVLGIGRAIGETMAVIMVAGNQPRMPIGLLKGARTLTANIVIEMGYAEGLHREALIATGVVLFAFILIINLAFAMMRRGKRE